MDIKTPLLVISVFILGVVSTLLLLPYFSSSPSTATAYTIANDDSKGHFITKILGMTNEEKPSPYNWISENQIKVEKERIVINLENALWSRFTDTNSMDPVIDKGANTIQIIPRNEADIHIGDIVSYKSEYASDVIIHRVVDIGYDSKGWYAIMKGDNNSREDPGKIRFNQIKRITVAVIY